MGSWRLWRRTGAWGNGAVNCGGSAVAVPRSRGGPFLGQVADVPVVVPQLHLSLFFVARPFLGQGW